RFDLPARTLRTGNNELIIRIDEGCWVLYDALRLDCTAGRAELAPTKPALRVSPLPQEQALYRIAGGLEQRIRFSVLNLGPAAEADIILDGHPLSRAGLTKGAQELSIRVPAASSKQVHQLD